MYIVTIADWISNFFLISVSTLILGTGILLLIHNINLIGKMIDNRVNNNLEEVE